MAKKENNGINDMKLRRTELDLFDSIYVKVTKKTRNMFWGRL